MGLVLLFAPPLDAGGERVAAPLAEALLVVRELLGRDCDELSREALGLGVEFPLPLFDFVFETLALFHTLTRTL
jgi:hypothetical protein